MRLTSWWMVMALAWSCGAPDAAVEDAAGPPDFETTEIADGIFEYRFQGHKGFFVRTSRGVVAFDPISTVAAVHYADEIKRVVPDAELAAIVYSHRDADHATGARVLMNAFGTDVPIIAHQNARQPLLDAANPDLPPPDSTFFTTLALGAGDDRIDLHYLGRSHSDDMLVAHVPRANVAFAVDFVAHDRLGYRDLGSFYFPDLFDALTGLQEIPYQTIVFGHGSVGDRASVDRQIQYYRDLQRLVQEAVDAGQTEDEAAESVMLSDYAGWEGYEDWRELNVRGMYRKLSS